MEEEREEERGRESKERDRGRWERKREEKREEAGKRELEGRDEGLKRERMKLTSTQHLKSFQSTFPS